MAAVGSEEIRAGIRELGLAGLAVCAHSSLSSFGRVEGGADAVIDAFLAEDCTLLVPSFSSQFRLAPVAGMRPERNGIDYEAEHPSPGADRVYTPATDEIEPAMGAVPAAVVRRPERARGNHPMDSFAAMGPGSESLVEVQRPLDVYAPLRILGARGGFVLLMGVGPNRLTLLHLAEEKSGRKLFRRWANGSDGRPMEIEAGGCSEGFAALEPVLAPLLRETRVGESAWRAYPAKEAVEAAAAAIRESPELTRCDDPSCPRCRDAIAGGPKSGRS